MSKFYQNNENTTDVWLTPPYIIEALGPFDLDPCCPNNLPWKTAGHYYSLERGEDGLLLPWPQNEFVWLNPPYSNWVPFMQKLKDHGNGIALIFARTETRGFRDTVWNGAAGLLFLHRRVKFVRADLTPGAGSTAPSVLIAYGEKAKQKLKTCNLEGKYLEL